MCLLVSFFLAICASKKWVFQLFLMGEHSWPPHQTRAADAVWCGLNHTLYMWEKKQWQQLLISSGLLHSQIRCAKDTSLPWDQKNRVRTHMQTHPGFLAISSLISFSAGKSSAVTRIARSSKRFVLYWTELVHTAGAIQCNMNKHLCFPYCTRSQCIES